MHSGAVRHAAIVVCVKHIPKRADGFDSDAGRFAHMGSGTLNQCDTHAVEEALRLVSDAADVTVLSYGPPEAADSLRVALAMGAARAVLVSDPRAIGSDLLATSRVVAAAIEREGARMVLLGQHATDTESGMLGAAVAERLRWPFLSQVMELTLQGGTVRLRRQTEAGYETIELELPAVLAVSDSINAPRYPSLKALMVDARRRPLEMRTLDELGIDADVVGRSGSGTQVLAVSRPPQREVGRLVYDKGAEALMDFLVENDFV